MGNVLVSYFSASGVTERAAKKLAKELNADLYAIKPVIPYTKADLNWNDKQSRSSLEMADKTFRPAIADNNVSISDYDVIYVGFPIWWYVAPTIVNTYLESYDFIGKRVIIFATSGGSGFGNTLDELQCSVSADTELIQGVVVKTLHDIELLVDML